MLFRPRRVAVIGATADPDNLGHRIVRNLVDTGFGGAVYPIHPRGGRLFDLPVYRSVEELPAPVSLAVVCVPRQAVLEVVEQCTSAQVVVVIIVSAGFAETDAEGQQLQQRIVDLASNQGCRVVGPNCVGVVNTDPSVRLNTTFCPVTTRPGNVSLCSQSGALGVLALAQGDCFQVGFCSGLEFMIGMTRDPQLGPVVAFGLGGTRVELVCDVCHRLAPLTDRDAHEMVRSIRSYPLLTGYRSRSVADVPAVEELLLRVPQLAVKLPQIRELDLNPVVVLPPTRDCRIVDARIRVGSTNE